MKSNNVFSALFLIFVLAVSGCAQTPELISSNVPQAKNGLEVTVYNSNLGVVKETRDLSLADGLNRHYFEGVASQIDATSVKLTSSDGSFVVLEQNYQYDLVSKNKLMEKFLGKKITGYKVVGDTKEVVEGILLASSSGELIIQRDDGTIQVVYVNDLVLPKLPEGLIIKPTLEWLIENEGAGDKKAELSYMTSGLTWKADYVAVVDKDDKNMDLTGWVTVTNNAGTTFNDASLKLVAGDVNRVQSPYVDNMLEERLYSAKAGAAQFQEEQLFEYHMYDLQRKTTLKDREQKQISLLTADGVGVEKEYVYESTGGWYSSGDNNKVKVKLNFKNSQDKGLGMPLPKGTFRVFKKDSEGMLQFIGEDSIDHTPKDETIRLLMGNAFDIVGERKRMKITDMGCQYEVEWEVNLKNHKDEDITVTVLERAYWDWTITRTNYDYVRESNEKIRFNIPVKANGESKLAYTIRYNHC
ncbi:MAG: DUF4139 domain-containing protein [Candidatus Altiarchaeota archaeon]|nr:DUF4139 domain-containing protein [Candidatus Altiarchaeota archaeon]